jgi:hypothetical protein
MTMDNTIINLISSFEFNIWWILLKLFIASLFLLSLRNKAYMIIDYFIFRSNKYLSIGSNVVVDGFEGIITKISLSEVIIENNNQIYIIPMTETKRNRWIINKVDCLNCIKKDGV